MLLCAVDVSFPRLRRSGFSIRVTIVVVVADYHFVDSKMMSNSDAVAAAQNCCCLLRDRVLVRVRDAVPHAPYSPYWLLPVQRPAVASICSVDFETIFSLVFR